MDPNRVLYLFGRELEQCSYPNDVVDYVKDRAVADDLRASALKYFWSNSTASHPPRSMNPWVGRVP